LVGGASWLPFTVNADWFAGESDEMSIFCRIDDKHVPLYRVVWVSATPHYCGEEDCVREGSYEIRLEQGEAVWASMAERDEMLQRLEAWHGGMDVPDDGEADDENWE
jgi:hypothetical protein